MWYINTQPQYGITHDSFIHRFDTDQYNIDDYYGFVYIIIEKNTNKKYIGKKFFWNKKILPKTKTRKTRKRVLVESDWRDYYGSSSEVQQLVEQNGVDNYRRIILKLCKSKGECSYYELKYQLETDALLKPDEYYNAFVGAKIHRKHILTMGKNGDEKDD